MMIARYAPALAAILTASAAAFVVAVGYAPDAPAPRTVDITWVQK